jgi:hypothetical protein
MNRGRHGTHRPRPACAMKRPEARDWMTTATVGPTARLVYLALWAHANREGLAYPSVPTLAGATGLGRATVQRALRELTTHGEVVPKPRVGATTGYFLPELSTGGLTARPPGASQRGGGASERAKKGPHSEAQKVVERSTERGAPKPKGGTAPPPQAGAVPFTDDRGTFLPGTGWVQ